MGNRPQIEKDEMMALMIAACPSFREEWESFVKEWVENPLASEESEDEPIPHYLALSDLANHLIVKLETGETQEFPADFDVVEQWVVRGCRYVSEAAVVGLPEDLTQDARYYKKSPADFVPWMGPTTKQWLPEVVDFWDRLDKGKFSPLFID